MDQEPFDSAQGERGGRAAILINPLGMNGRQVRKRIDYQREVVDLKALRRLS